ncbi:hypothetical protein [Streptomyces sp. NPDC001389]
MCSCGALPDHDECSTCAVPAQYATPSERNTPPPPAHADAYPDEQPF